MKNKNELLYSFDFDERDTTPVDMDELSSRQVLIFVDTLPITRQLRIKRAHDGLTQSQLAEKLGMGVSTLCEIERERRKIPSRFLAAIYLYLYREWYSPEGELIDIIEQ